ncbi:MAG: hypothetical protein ABSB70_04940 [Candidatus Velthaea sp.]|jgi:uncharacterized lipoprotein YbaY
MKSSAVRLVSSIAAVTLALTVSAQADQGLRLATVAAEDGFTYQWMPTEAGAVLARPGVRVVIRAGRLFYEVNNANPIADSAPRFDGRDLIISAKLAEHLRLIAAKYAISGAKDRVVSQPADMSAAMGSNTAEGPLTLQAKAIPGHEALALRGTAPANATLTVTLRGEVSTDLPVVVLSRKDITTATDGTFSAEVYYGQQSHVRTTLVATVTTLSGASSAEARVTVGVPSPQIKSSGLDDWPKK